MFKHPALRLALVVLLLELCGALSLVAGIFSYSQSRINTQQISSFDTDLKVLDKDLRQELSLQAVTALEQARNAAETQQLIGEINYICTISAARATESGLPPPSAGLCNLVIPTPKP